MGIIVPDVTNVMFTKYDKPTHDEEKRILVCVKTAPLKNLPPYLLNVIKTIWMQHWAIFGDKISIEAPVVSGKHIVLVTFTSSTFNDYQKDGPLSSSWLNCIAPSVKQNLLLCVFGEFNGAKAAWYIDRGRLLTIPRSSL